MAKKKYSEALIEKHKAWFEEKFWPICPRKESKNDAFKAILDKDPTDEEKNKLFLAMQAHARHHAQNGTAREYIKLPATWIRAGCEDDELVTKSDQPREKSVNGTCGAIEKEKVCGKPGVQYVKDKWLCSWHLTKICSINSPTSLAMLREYFKKHGLARKPNEDHAQYIERLKATAKNFGYRGGAASKGASSGRETEDLATHQNYEPGTGDVPDFDESYVR